MDARILMFKAILCNRSHYMCGSTCSFIHFLFVFSSYRKSEEVQQFRKEKDPITTATRYLLEGNLATEDELKQIRKSIQEQIKKDVASAISDTEPPLDEMFTDIYTNTPQHMVRGCDPFTWGNSERADA